MYHAIVFLPLIGFLLAGLFAKSLGAKGCEYITTGLLMISAALSWIAFFTVGFSDAEPETVQVLQWISSGDLNVNWAFRIDTLTVVMLVRCEHGFGARSPLFNRLHASRPASSAVLCLLVGCLPLQLLMAGYI